MGPGPPPGGPGGRTGRALPARDADLGAVSDETVPSRCPTGPLTNVSRAAHARHRARPGAARATRVPPVAGPGGRRDHGCGRGTRGQPLSAWPGRTTAVPEASRADRGHRWSGSRQPRGGAWKERAGSRRKHGNVDPAVETVETVEVAI
ncbi:hypothetical protein GCM10009654_00510 [Streptomyces hebeiensis]|uniref:Uncharacterized protein n=1 Tax=Streptomyces hebeiensis TaxID=229486 RepID=A0ABN1UH88_9ACTN